MSSPYEVAVHLTAVNGVSSVLAAISKDVLGLRSSLKDLEKGFSALRLGVVGAAGVAAGLGGFAILKDVSKYAKDLSHELVQIQKLGIPNVDFNRVRDQAKLVTNNVPGTTEVDALKTFGSSYSIFGTDNALKLMEPLARFEQVVGNATGDFEKASHDLYSMIRSGDLMGKFMDENTHQLNTESLNKFLDLGGRVMLATHNKVDSNTWLGLAQQGGPALSQLSDKGLLTMAIASQAMGGQRAGTALTSLYQQMVGGKMPEYAAGELHKLGMVGDYKVGRGGHILWEKGALDNEFTNELREDPIKAVEKLRNAMVTHGFDTIEKQVPELFQILGRSTTQRLVHDLLRNLPQVLGERERIEGVLGLGKSVDLQNTEDLMQVEHNVKTAYTNMMTAFAGPSASVYINVLNSITAALNSVTNALRGVDPQVIKNIFEAIGLVSAGLFSAGTLAIVLAIGTALGPAGAVIGGLTALAGVIAYLSGAFKSNNLDNLDMHDRGRAKAPPDLLSSVESTYDAVKLTVEKVYQVFKIGAEGLLKAIEALAPSIVSAIGSIPSKATTALSSMTSAISLAIGDALTSLKSRIVEIPDRAKQMIDAVAKALGDAIASIPSKVMDAISGMAAGIAGAIGKALKNIPNGMHDPNSSGGASYEGGGVGGMIHHASLGGYTANASGITGGGTLARNFEGLNVLPGHGATAGGGAQPGLTDAARMLQEAYPGVGFTALNDAAHQHGLGSGPHGAHGTGRAFDAVMANIEHGKAVMRSRLAAMGFREGRWGSGAGDFSIEPGTGGGTGAHMHFQWNNSGAAARFHDMQHPSKSDVLKHFPKPNSAPVQVQSVLNVDGRKLAHAVSTHQVRGARTAGSTGRFDVADHPSPTDLVYT